MHGYIYTYYISVLFLEYKLSKTDHNFCCRQQMTMVPGTNMTTVQRTVLTMFLLSTFPFLLLVTHSQASSISEPINIASASMEASILLEAAGISGLCHPTSNEFAPYFPRCSSSLPRRVLYDPYYDESQETEPSVETERNPESDWYYIRNGLGALLCLLTAAYASGLTIGLVSLDPQILVNKIRSVSTTEKERDQAACILPVVRKHHLLLVTLLLLNSIANEALPIFLDSIFPTHMALLIAVIGVLFFGEIIPSAVFTGPHKMTIASKMVPLVRCCMFVLFPVAYPISKILDCVVKTEKHACPEETSYYAPPPEIELRTREAT